MQIINFYPKKIKEPLSTRSRMCSEASIHYDDQKYARNWPLFSKLNFYNIPKKKNPKGPKEKKYMKIIFILQLLEPQSLHIIWIMLMGAPRAIVNKLL